MSIGAVAGVDDRVWDEIHDHCLICNHQLSHHTERENLWYFCPRCQLPHYFNTSAHNTLIRPDRELVLALRAAYTQHVATCERYQQVKDWLYGLCHRLDHERSKLSDDLSAWYTSEHSARVNVRLNEIKKRRTDFNALIERLTPYERELLANPPAGAKYDPK